MLLRSPGSSHRLQSFSTRACRSWCPAGKARPFIYAAKRFSCGPGPEAFVPTKQFYTKMLFCDPVVLGVVSAPAIYAYVEAALGPWDQSPLFKSHFSIVINLRCCKPPLDRGILHR